MKRSGGSDLAGYFGNSEHTELSDLSAPLFLWSVASAAVANLSIDSLQSGKPGWEQCSFHMGNEPFFARSRKSGLCAEAYIGTPDKQGCRLTPRLRKRAVSVYGLPPFCKGFVSMMTGTGLLPYIRPLLKSNLISWASMKSARIVLIG